MSHVRNCGEGCCACRRIGDCRESRCQEQNDSRSCCSFCCLVLVVHFVIMMTACFQSCRNGSIHHGCTTGFQIDTIPTRNG